MPTPNESGARPRVYARIRPQSEKEIRNGGTKSFHASDEPGHTGTLMCDDPSSRRTAKTTTFQFDRVFDDSSQVEVFSHIGEEVLDTLSSGYDVSVFAYGQTGSGKTFTMEGECDDPEQRGIIPRTLDGIFERFHSNRNITENSISVQISLVQIHNDRIEDLFNGRKQLGVRIHDGSSEAHGAQWITATDAQQALRAYNHGVRLRATNATAINQISSRSHTILMVRLAWDERAKPGCCSQLNLIDLAGSEKLSHSGATGDVMRETIAINESLSTLGMVVSKLVDASNRKPRQPQQHSDTMNSHPPRQHHIPFRNSKLTHLLQSSLGGNSHVHFVLTISSSSLWRTESLDTIAFGKQMLKLVLGPSMKCSPSGSNRVAGVLKTNADAKASPLDRPRGLPPLHQQKRVGNGEGRSWAEDEADGGWNRGAGGHAELALVRIVNNLPETLEDLISHCVLHSASKSEFRLMNGLQKLVHIIDKSPSTRCRARAAHTVAAVLDDEGRRVFGELGGIGALGRLLTVPCEQCKEAACVALDVVFRSCLANKQLLTFASHHAIVDLVSCRNQRVQDAACGALASLVDAFDEGKRQALSLGLVEKLIHCIDGAAGGVVHVIKAAVNCLSRLARGDHEVRREIQRQRGLEVLFDRVLFPPASELEQHLDPEFRLVGSTALVNSCFGDELNMEVARRHCRWEEIQFRLLEGLARSFGIHCARGSDATGTTTALATPRDTNNGASPYHGVAVLDRWTPATSGGRPIFPSFWENPQFSLLVKEDTRVSFVIQDLLYQQRTTRKEHEPSGAVCMGLAIFVGDADLVNAGLTDLDFVGKPVDIVQVVSNCENVLHCTLKGSDTPYIVVPFTFHRGQTTSFALSVFAEQQVKLRKIPDERGSGWTRRDVLGGWSEVEDHAVARGEWHNGPQVALRPSLDARVVFVLSYESLDGSHHSARPQLSGRLLATSDSSLNLQSANGQALVEPHSVFVAGTSFSSNRYVVTLRAGKVYTYVPLAEGEHPSGNLLLRMYSDERGNGNGEWDTKVMKGVWKAGEPIRFAVCGTGLVCVVASCEGVHLRILLDEGEASQERSGGVLGFHQGKCHRDFVLNPHETVVAVVDGIMMAPLRSDCSRRAGSVASDPCLHCRPCCNSATPLSALPADGRWHLLSKSSAGGVLGWLKCIIHNEERKKQH